MQLAHHRFPQLIPDGLTPQEHLQEALLVQHPCAVAEPSTKAVKMALQWCDGSERSLVHRRERVCKVLVRLAAATVLENDDIFKEGLHPDVARVLQAYCPKNVVFMRELVATLDPADDEAIMCLCLGPPMLGWAPSARGLMMPRQMVRLLCI